MPDSLSTRQLARSLIRQLRLKRGARLLHVGCGNGELVGRLRRAGIQAFGLFDGPSQSRADDSSEVPDLQPATLHQSIPFLVQSFDAVILCASSVYNGSLATPEACTATANLLAVLKPGGRFVYCGEADFRRMKEHLARFSDQGKHITLGTGGLWWLVKRLLGIAGPGLPALQLTVPAEPTSRLEWHRIARQAVAHLNRAVAEERTDDPELTADTPAA